MRKLFVVFTLLLSTLFCKEDGMIIILNGPSSAGKTTIQKALQKESKETFLRVGIDTFFDALIEEPDLSRFEEEGRFDQYTADGEYIRGIEMTKDRSNHPVVTLKVGPAGDRIIHGMHRAIAAYAEAGNNVIVDYILYKPEWLDDLKESLRDHKVLYVGVYAPLTLIEEREKKRNTSPVGHARSHFDTVHTDFYYDLEIDSETETPEQNGHKILNHLGF